MIVLCFLSMYAVLPSPVNWAASNEKCPPHIWISQGEQTTKKNGGLVQRYHIRNNRNDWGKIEEKIGLQAIYSLRNYSSADVEYYHAPIKRNGDDVFLDVECDTNAMIRLFVLGACEDKCYTAQIATPLFGRASKGSSKPGKLAEGFPENRPRLHLKPSIRDYYMQTGRDYLFEYSAIGPDANKAEILENGKIRAQIALGPDGNFAYTPLHDITLDRAGPRARKETVVFVQEEAYGKVFSTTHTLVLHRSITAHLDLSQGLVLLGATFALFSMFVVYKRRFGNNPWFPKSD